MLRELIKMIAEGQAQSRAELAKRLEVSEGLVGRLLQDLTRMGYLRTVADGCEARCTGCALGKTCAVGSSTRVWALTEKGRLVE